MLSLNNDFIGYHPQEHIASFSGSDTSTVYERNLKTKPEDWYYRTNKISYIRNSNGHRCKTIEDIDLDNYILTVGCSHTEGIGLHLEDTYPYLLSKKLNCDYYNLGMGGTGIDILNYNLVIWFSKIKKPPKLLIVQWPNHVRVTLENYPKFEGIEPTPYTSHGIWTRLPFPGISDFLVSGDKINFFKTTRTLTKNVIHNIANCPILEISTGNDIFSDNNIVLKQVDFARDHSTTQLHGHMGIESQKINTEMLYKEAIKLINT